MRREPTPRRWYAGLTAMMVRPGEEKRKSHAYIFTAIQYTMSFCPKQSRDFQPGFHVQSLWVSSSLSPNPQISVPCIPAAVDSASSKSHRISIFSADFPEIRAFRFQSVSQVACHPLDFLFPRLWARVGEYCQMEGVVLHGREFAFSN